MKINWLGYSLRSVYAVLAIGALNVIWIYLKWPWASIVKTLFLLSVLCGYVISYLVKREKRRKEALREEIRALSNVQTLEGDFTIGDFDLLYDVDELKRLVSILKEMPEGQRKLQTAVDVVEKESM
ncbi:MAG: hypothetical protein ABI977_09465 [Acidobacteriota bacterium]